MSTRCNIVIEKKDDTLYLYHHCDGYPEGVGAELLKLKDTLKRGMTPSDVYDTLVYLYGDDYEPTEGLHGDVEYVYTIKLDDDDAKIIFKKCVRRNPMKYSEYSLDIMEVHSFQYVVSDANGNDTYTKGGLFGKKARFTCDFTIDVKDSRVYAEMPDEIEVNPKKFFELLLRAYAGEIVDNTKIEILQ